MKQKFVLIWPLPDTEILLILSAIFSTYPQERYAVAVELTIKHFAIEGPHPVPFQPLWHPCLFQIFSFTAANRPIYNPQPARQQQLPSSWLFF
ncbi:MAG: hypothetical protein EAY79_04645 [Runella slithyformis]|nr:MAG: hypothetical protein EAY79_04645 [Runella slithyformis]TAF02218.1 MAG: hypothetical protein EAZ80_01715 [Runella slithyformis]